MRLLKVSAIIYLLTVAIDMQLPSLSYATHMCCSQATCGGWHCSCPCQNGCKCTTRSPEGDDHTFQVYTPNNVTVDVRAARMPDDAERLMHLTKAGACARREFALRILGNAPEHLMIQSFSIGGDPSNDTPVQVATTIEH